MERQRGQVLPLWAFAILAMLVLAVFTINYANVVRWQIRAQNAADAAAQSILALQTQQFNQMTIMLYASAIEEFRVRRLMQSMLLAAHQQGGCSDPASCDAIYQSLRPQFLTAVQRYTNDVITTNKITANIRFDTTIQDATALIGRLTAPTQCGTATGGDCAFNYAIVDMRGRTEGLETVKADALGIQIPSFSNHTAAAQVNPQLFAPAKVEVAVCARIPAAFNGFFSFLPHPYFAIGRAAATAVMVEQDWMQPGQILNPINGGAFQPSEAYVAPSTGPYDWYTVDFGGNITQAYETYNVFSSSLTSDEFSARLGWWNEVPIPAYMGPQAEGTLGCQAAAPPP